MGIFPGRRSDFYMIKKAVLLLSKMNYDVVWEDLDPNHTKISKRTA